MIKISFAILLSFITCAVFAKDFGVRGPVYNIAEENLLHLIHRRLYILQQNGELEQMQEIVKEHVKQNIKRPEPVKGISKATENRAWTYDPTWVLNNSIFDLKGELIAKKGQRVNPLNWAKMSETLLLIDADNPAEITFAKQLLANEANLIKIILVNGNVSDLVNHLNKPIYFDQQGLITRHFGILHTPAIVKQNRNVLTIKEIAL